MVAASQQALLKALTKDLFYIGILQNKFNSLCQQICGNDVWLRWKNEIELVSRLLYFFITTVKGSQTLGEEYAGVIQVTSDLNNVPGLASRIALVLLHCFTPYVLTKCSVHFQDTVQSSPDDEFPKPLRRILMELPNIVQIFRHAHILLFFNGGVYLDVAKRILGVKQILIRPLAKYEVHHTTFSWLTFLGCLQLFAELHVLVQKINANSSEVVDDDDTTDEQAAERSPEICVLCLQLLRFITVTPCGHAFCWKCIVEWCSGKPNCPVCREPCYPSRLLVVNKARLVNRLKNTKTIKTASTDRRPAAVLVPLCLVNGKMSLLFMKRPLGLFRHAGQVSFPGGKKCSSDLTLTHVALRETHEEFGVEPRSIDVYAMLNQPFFDRAGLYEIRAVVGYLGDVTIEKLHVDPFEVSDVFALPVVHLLDPRNQRYTRFRNGWTLPVFPNRHHLVWGITAVIVDEFLARAFPQRYHSCTET